MSQERVEKPRVEIIEALLEDAEQICKVQAASWLKAYPNKEVGITAEMIQKRFEDREGRITRWKNTIQHPTSTVWVAKENGAVVGFCGVQKTEEEHRLSSIYIDPEKQGSGVGGALLQHAVAYLGREKDIVLDVVSYNDKAIGFYKKYGFEIEGDVPPEKLLKVGGIALPESRMILRAL